MPANEIWNIAFGPYAFAVHRKELTYRLEETETGIVWADGLSLGSVEIIERDTGSTTRYPFGAMKLITLSEKSGATGKRILFGLDAPGRIPVDVYLTCTDREIQITVEANRDTKTHTVGEIVLLPDLCAAPDDGASHLVIPHREGVILRASGAPENPVPLRIWDANTGLTMPFVGAVRHGAAGRSSALAMLTDSAYGVADLSRTPDSARLDLRYERDPERRRLDVRVVLMPGGDHVSIARAYRDKISGDGGHVTLRKKSRERPELESLIAGEHEPLVCEGGEFGRSTRSAVPLRSIWMEMEANLAAWTGEVCPAGIRSARAGGDWFAVGLDLWHEDDTERSVDFGRLSNPDTATLPDAPAGVLVPLRSVVYHDAVPTAQTFHSRYEQTVLRALLNFAPPRIIAADGRNDAVAALLRPLYRLTFFEFLTGHRFLTPDFAVEEARYSHGTRVVINQSETNDYEADDLHLPPLGFYVSQKQMTAHFARRVGDEKLEVAEWRVDGVGV